MVHKRTLPQNHRVRDDDDGDGEVAEATIDRSHIHNVDVDVEAGVPAMSGACIDDEAAGVGEEAAAAIGELVVRVLRDVFRRCIPVGRDIRHDDRHEVRRGGHANGRKDGAGSLHDDVHVRNSSEVAEGLREYIPLPSSQVRHNICTLKSSR